MAFILKLCCILIELFKFAYYCVVISGISYGAGDVLMIRPQNTPNTVNEFLNLLSLDPDVTFVLQQSDPDVVLPDILPQQCTIGYLVQHYLDINGTPKR